MAKPQSIVHSVVVEGVNFLPVVMQESADWEDEEDQTPLNPASWFQQLLEMSPKEREDHKLAQRLQDDVQRLRERFRFRNGQMVFINSSRKARDGIFGPEAKAPKDLRMA